MQTELTSLILSHSKIEWAFMLTTYPVDYMLNVPAMKNEIAISQLLTLHILTDERIGHHGIRELRHATIGESLNWAAFFGGLQHGPSRSTSVPLVIDKGLHDIISQKI